MPFDRAKGNLLRRAGFGERLVRALEKRLVPKVKEYDPFDEKRQLTFEEFIALAKQELDDYYNLWAKEPRNEYHNQPHTWNEWWGGIHRYWSW